MKHLKDIAFAALAIFIFIGSCCLIYKAIKVTPEKQARIQQAEADKFIKNIEEYVVCHYSTKHQTCFCGYHTNWNQLVAAPDKACGK